MKPVIIAFLQRRGLELSEEKTLLTHIEDGFDFLGQNIRKYNAKLLIKPSKESVKCFRRKIRDLVQSTHRGSAAHVLIGRLNPVIRGWVNYHRHCVAAETFHSLSHYIFRCVWQWARREHPNKGAIWRYDKYFSHGPRKWEFSTLVPKGFRKNKSTILHLIFRPYLTASHSQTPQNSTLFLWVRSIGATKSNLNLGPKVVF